jgi:hypothetical protein
MICSVIHFALPKYGNEIKDYEDAFAPKMQGKVEQSSMSVAIADGATESSFAADWARMLTRAFVKEPFTSIDILQSKTQFLSNRWQGFVNRRPLPWFAEEKVRSGAFATLLGVEITPKSNGSLDSGQWSAIAVGDSCLFQLRGEELLLSFPLRRSTEFGNSPTLLSSNLTRNDQVWENVRVNLADWQSGDTFFLATDALACWFLSQHELKERPWEILLGFADDSNPLLSFKAWADKLRLSSEMKNDDVTLVMLRL